MSHPDSQATSDEPAGRRDGDLREEVQRAFGSVLRRLRDERGISQEDLAFSSGVGRSFIAKMETGKRQPTITTVFRLADALGVSPQDVVGSVQNELAGPT